MNPVALLHAEAGSAPTGTGSYAYWSNFSVLVQNLAFAKLVGIWGHDFGSGTWSFHPCGYDRSVPGGGEIWKAHVLSPIDQFDVEYAALGNVYWDNNAGYNYTLDAAAAEGTDGVATVVINPAVLAVESGVDGAGNLNVDVLVQNIAYTKQVAIVYSADHWLTFQNAFGTYSQSFAPANSPHQLSAELWTITAPVGVGTTGEFAVFLSVGGATYWDNNFGVNYSF